MEPDELTKWARGLVKRCTALAPAQLWRYLDGQFLELLECAGAASLPDETSLEAATDEADEGDSGYYLSDGVNTFWQHDSWLWIATSTDDWMLKWAAELDEPGRWHLSDEKKRALTKPLMAMVKRSKLDGVTWLAIRLEWNLGQLRAEVAQYRKLKAGQLSQIPGDEGP